MARPYTIQAEFQADFRKLEAEANKFGDRFGKVVKEAMSLGSDPRITASLKDYLKEYKKEQKKLVKEMADYEYKIKFKTAQDVADEQIRLNQKIAQAEAKLQDTATDEAAKEQAKADKKKAERDKRRLARDKDEQEREIKRLLDSQKEHERRVRKTGKSAEATVERIARGQKVSEEYAERFRKIMNASGEDFVETVEGGLERLSSSLRGSIDLGSMIKGGAGGLSKGAGGLADMFSGAAAGAEGGMAALASTAAAMAAAVGAVVGVLGVFAAVMVGVDKEIKEFNKSAINTFGSRSVMAFAAGGELADGLRTLRHSVQDLTNNLGLTEQEAVGLFDTLDQGGFTLAKISKGVRDTAEAKIRLNKTLRDVVATSKAIGVSVNEFTNQATEMANTYGDSLEGIIGQFASINKMAQEAGFSTRRFYSLVVQATSSQAGLNTRIAESAEILSRMSKILGDKQAAGFLEQMGGSFEKASSTDLMKTALLAGLGRTKDIARDQLKSQSRVFLGAAEGGGKMAGLQAEASKVGITSIDINNPEDFARKLADLEAGDRNRLISSVIRMDSGLGRRLGSLVKLSENVEGGLTDIPEAMRTFDAGGVVREYAAIAENFGFKLDDMNAIQRTAFANMSGLDEEQINQMQSLARYGDGTFRELQALGAETTNISEEQKEAMLKQYGAYSEGGKVYDAQGTELVNAFDYLTTAEATNHLDDEKIMAKDLKLAYDAFDQTVTIGDILENKVVYYLRSLYENVGEPLMRWLGQKLGFNDEKRATAATTRNKLYDAIQSKQRTLSEATRTVSSLESRPAADLTNEQKTQLEEARRTAEAARTFIDRAQEATRALSSGEYSRLDKRETYDVTVSADRDLVGRDPDGGRAAALVMSLAGIGGPHVETRTRTRTMTPEEFVASLETPRPTGATPPARPPSGEVLMSVAPETMMSVGPEAVPNMSVASPTPPAASPAVAPTAAPVPAGGTVGGAASSRGERAAEDATSTVTDAIESSGDTGATATREAGEETRTTMENEHEETRKHLTKVLTKDVKLGNALARSELPQAIVDAQVRQQLMSLAFAAGMSDPTQIGATIDEYFTQGTFSNELRGALTTSGEDLTTGPLAGLYAGLGGAGRLGTTGLVGRHRLPSAAAAVAGASEENAAEDFVYRGDGVRGTITPIDERDTFVGMKPGGAIDRAVNGGGGGSVTVNIYGGDERRVYDVVKRVLQQSGIGPSRVAARA